MLRSKRIMVHPGTSPKQVVRFRILRLPHEVLPPDDRIVIAPQASLPYPRRSVVEPDGRSGSPNIVLGIFPKTIGT